MQGISGKSGTPPIEPLAIHDRLFGLIKIPRFHRITHSLTGDPVVGGDSVRDVDQSVDQVEPIGSYRRWLRDVVPHPVTIARIEAEAADGLAAERALPEG